ncbi:hypothetical protein Glove_13g142 [Diversispora epigaea]|uniref:GATA-type domain-containing protein n=1 Tax=Diversispora epigaea TaxID=1348612 RepID=A0A397JRN9_9GLOM|nr:hypothetical protein Glove_13g142 [Diversispora epigaea]
MDAHEDNFVFSCHLNGIHSKNNIPPNFKFFASTIKKTKTTIGSPITNNRNEKFYIYHCSNCGARETSAWRRDLQGEALLWNMYLRFVFKSKKLSKTNRVGSVVEWST